MKHKIKGLIAAASLAIAPVAAGWDVLSPAGNRIEFGG
jgi:hypothetical protein